MDRAWVNMSVAPWQSFTRRGAFSQGAALAALVMVSGCASGLGTVTVSTGTSLAKRPPARSTVLVTIPLSPAAYGFEESSGRISGAGQGAKDAVKTLLDAGAGSGEGAVVVVALLPIAAAVGAIAGSGKEIPAAQVKLA